jgi:hypothetical protein
MSLWPSGSGRVGGSVVGTTLDQHLALESRVAAVEAALTELTDLLLSENVPAETRRQAAQVLARLRGAP